MPVRTDAEVEDETLDETEAEETEETEGEEPERVRDAEAVLSQNRKLAAENRGLRKKVEDGDAELERLRKLEDASKTEREREIDEIRKKAETEAEAKYRKLLLGERIQARAARRFADPEDVVRLLDLDDLADDAVDTIDAALKDLAEAKPYLLADSNGRRDGKKIPDADQGSRGTPPGGGKKESPDDWLLGLAGRD